MPQQALQPSLPSATRHFAAFLGPDELYGLTQRRRRDAQVRMLRAMGVEHRVRADGTVAVLRAHVEQLFGAARTPRIAEADCEPDWSAV